VFTTLSLIEIVLQIDLQADIIRDNALLIKVVALGHRY
jgi:hypothetical protein